MRALVLAAALALLPLLAVASPASAEMLRHEVGAVSADAQAPWFGRHLGEVSQVEPLYATQRTAKFDFSVLRGATVTLRPTPGMTAEWLQYTLNEHLASMAANPSQSMPSCPLALGNTHARVRSLGASFAIDIEGDSKVAGEEILRRAQALLSP